ncbi:MAG TPA: MMPL family transporter [Parasegetibacter sp.]
MAYWAGKVELSYEFTRAIPTDNPKYQLYQEFKSTFGEDGNLLVIGVQTDDLFKEAFFNDYRELQSSLKEVRGVKEILAVPGALNLIKDTVTEKLRAVPVFAAGRLNQEELDSSAAVFLNLPFYQGILYNPESRAYMMALTMDNAIINSPARVAVVDSIVSLANAFGERQKTEVYLSGLPLIRTMVAQRIENEMRWFLIGSFVLSAVILLLFFRSVSATLLSLGVVLAGVIWSMGTMHLLGYKITLLTALIPPLIVVIGIPNCIYFLNKYHTAYNEEGEKRAALIHMISRMGIVTLFCNISAAIGFAVFGLTRSEILKEFGAVAGLNIMVIFFISFILIPIVLSYLPSPKNRHTRYLDNKWLATALERLEIWALGHRKTIYTITGLMVVAALAGMLRLKSEAFIVDDLPETDKIYTDLKFFEKNFEGVMPLEIVVDTKKKNGFTGMRALREFEKMDELARYLDSLPEMARPLYLGEGLKFARQAFYEGDSTTYSLPNSFDGAFVADYLRPSKDTTKSAFTEIFTRFMDSSRRQARISVQMADIGSKRLPELLSEVEMRSRKIFDTSAYDIKLTGTSVTFVEGSRFIISGLKESIFWAFLLIALCMLYLFKSLRILICSLIPNVIPLLITAGIMGWTGVPLKPSTVLIFSVALGIAIDVTIRFLVNYKQELPLNGFDEKKTVIETIHNTGISIIYTSLVLTAGFVIFCFSSFGGTQALGWLTSLTLVSATLTNLILLPALLISTRKKEKN